MAPVVLGPRCNRQVTCDSNTANDRSESSLAINPTDHYNLIGSSKIFIDPSAYRFSLAAYASWDGGQTWTDSGPMPLPATVSSQQVDGISDPTVTFDDQGTAYLLGLAFANAPTPHTQATLLGMVVYTSADKGRTWSVPTIVHQGIGDDKQIIAGDTNPSSAYIGHVYATWDGTAPGNNSGVIMARTTDHGASWKGLTVAGVDQPTGSLIIPNALYSTIAIDSRGHVHVSAIGRTAQGQNAVLSVVSTDGGNSFGPVTSVAAPIVPINGVPGNLFRSETIPTSCITGGDRVVVAWPDARNGSDQVFSVLSQPDGIWPNNPSLGSLLTASQPSPAGQSDIMPQLAATPDGTVGCAVYEYGPKTAGGPPLIDVHLLVSTNQAASFDDRVTVTDRPWDPSVDLPTDSSGRGFIGDYFGLAAGDLGFFPFWTDTRTGVQEIFTSRLAVNPTDMLLRDSSSDTGTVPSPGDHWEAPDLVVSYTPNPPVPWQSMPLIPGQDHYIFAKVSNLGTNQARSVRLAVTIGNFPGLLGMPGSEFRYPQDWYDGDWTTAILRNNHTFLGETAPTNIAAGAAAQIVGPLTWPAAEIPAEGTWHPCLLAEVRCDNDDSAGGPDGCPIQASANACFPGSFFWGDNNICQRNVTYAPVVLREHLHIVFPFILGSPWSDAELVEIMVDKGMELRELPMQLSLRRIEKVMKPAPELAIAGGAGVAVAGNGKQAPDESELQRRVLGPEESEPVTHERLVGAHIDGEGWRLTHARAGVAIKTRPGVLYQGILRFQVDPREVEELAERGATVRILQRNDRRIVTGGVVLHLGQHGKA